MRTFVTLLVLCPRVRSFSYPTLPVFTSVIGWRAESMQRHEDTLKAVRATAEEQVHFNVQGVSTMYTTLDASHMNAIVPGRVQQGACLGSSHALGRSRQVA